MDEILGGMPLTFLHQSGGPGVDLDDDFDLGGGIPEMDPEGTLEMLGGIEVGGALEGGGTDAELGDAGEGEGTDAGVLGGLRRGIEREEVPLLVVIPQVVGMDAALAGLGVLEALVAEQDLASGAEG